MEMMNYWTSWGWAGPSSAQSWLPRQDNVTFLLSGCFLVRWSDFEIVILRSDSIQVIFHLGHHPLRSSSIEVIFHLSRFQLRSTSKNVVFHWGCVVYGDMVLVALWIKLKLKLAESSWAGAGAGAGTELGNKIDIIMLDYVLGTYKCIKMKIDSKNHYFLLKKSGGTFEKREKKL